VIKDLSLTFQILETSSYVESNLIGKNMLGIKSRINLKVRPSVSLHSSLSSSWKFVIYEIFPKFWIFISEDKSQRDDLKFFGKRIVKVWKISRPCNLHSPMSNGIKFVRLENSRIFGSCWRIPRERKIEAGTLKKHILRNMYQRTMQVEPTL